MQEISPPPATFTRICRYLRSKSRRIDRGFTLIEITMVIVVIGLGIGGIFVGKDMIKSAEIRSQIAQIEEFKAAVNTFKLKYNALPGDISPRETAQLGFFTFTGTYAGQEYIIGTNRQGYGDNSGDIVLFNEGFYVFWAHLVDAKLITGQYGKAANGASCLISDMNATSFIVVGTPFGGTFPGPTCLATFPTTKLSTPTSSITVRANRGATNSKSYTDSQLPNYFSFMATPYQQYSIDSKIDDGLPDKGRVRNSGTAGGSLGVTPCVTKGTPNAYDLTPATADKPGSGGVGYCSLDILW